jgi:pyruvate formate-lyase activating enzyme-like uncharacterized protein
MTEFIFEIENKIDQKNIDELNRYKIEVEANTPANNTGREYSNDHIIEWLSETTDIKFLRNLRERISNKMKYREKQYHTNTDTHTRDYAKYFYTEYATLNDVVNNIIWLYERIYKRKY